MRTPRKSLVCLAILLVALALPVPASAYHSGSTQVVSFQVGETPSIPFNNWTGYVFNLASGDSIQYGIQSTSDNIDVFFFDAAGMAQYRADPPQTAQAISSILNRTQFGGVWNGASGQITVVVDNVDFSGAIPLGSVDVQVALVKLTGGAPPTDFFSGIVALGLAICVGVIVVIVAVIALIIYLITKGSRPPVPPPQPPYAPPQQPWPPQPPQGGAPPEQYPPQYPPQGP